MPNNLLMLGFGPRVWLCVMAIVVCGWTMHANAPGFYLTGELSATDTEREEGMVALGNDVVLIVRDKPIYDRQIAPMIGLTVRLVVMPK